MNKLPINWKEVKLKDALNDYIRGPFGSALKRNELLNKGIAVYEQQHAIYNTRNFRYFIDKNKYEQLKRFTVFENDLIISCSGTLGKVSIIKENDTFGIISQALLLLRPNINIVYPKYLYYYFFSNIGYNALLSRSTGSVQINIAKRKDIENIKLNLPPLEEQKRIASILSSLDDKIELNNKTNRILEEMAQSIFNEWFINFNFPNEDGKPYKKSGGEMIDSELGKIPKGWKVGVINDLISNLFNGDWGKDENKEKYTEEVICIRGTDIGDISKGFDGNPVRRFILEKNLKSKKLLEGDIVIECSGGSPTQSTGRCIFVTENLLSAYDKPLICTNFCKIIKVKEKEYMGYTYNLLLYLYNTRLFFLFENGTTGIKNLDVNNLFKRHIIIIPDKNVASEYNKIFLSLINLMHANKKENQKLSGIRDILLPKLMSGKIRVN